MSGLGHYPAAMLLSQVNSLVDIHKGNYGMMQIACEGGHCPYIRLIGSDVCKYSQRPNTIDTHGWVQKPFRKCHRALLLYLLLFWTLEVCFLCTNTARRLDHVISGCLTTFPPYIKP